MFCSVTIKCLAILTVMYNQQQLLAYCEYSQDSVTALNILLKFPAWGQIDSVRAKNGNDSFTGLDLYLTYVDASNVAINHRKAIYLLACVYANALLQFITSVQCIIQQNYREVALMRNRLRGRMRSNQKRRKVGENVATKFYSPDYTINWELLNLAVSKIKNGIPMFRCMCDAMVFLKYLVVPMEVGYLEIVDLVLFSVRRLHSVALNTIDVLPGYQEGYQNAEDSKVARLNQDLSRYLQNLVKSNLVPFTNAYCILPDSLQLYMTERSTTIDNDLPAEGLKVKKLVEEVVSNYSELGFEYVKQYQNNHDKPEISEADH